MDNKIFNSKIYLPSKREEWSLFAGLQPVIKTVLDYVGAVFGIITLLFLYPVVAFLIKIDSRGPVFYVQKRCGLNGKEFGMYKFRTMFTNADELKNNLKNEAEGSVFKIKNDPRITRVGKFLRRTSLDEFPQIFNVLKGEMSLVGPRPLAYEEMSGCEEWRALRLKKKPGITGLWQVKGRGSKSFNDWIQYDKEYVLNYSILLDMKIIFLTIGAIIKGNGAY